jgi:DNA-binding NarL/FixJ family response regulator
MRARAGSAIAVELAVDDAGVAERVRALLSGHADLRLIEPGEGAEPAVRITDGATERAADAAVIVITDRSGALEALDVGAAAVLSEGIDRAGLHAAIRAAAAGLTCLTREFRDLLVNGSDEIGGLEAETEEPAHVELTSREQQVLQLLAQGASNKTIARRLAITPHTAKFHVASIVAKLAATGRTDAVAKAMRLGLVMI